MDPKKPSLLHRLFIRNREGGHPLALEPSESPESATNGHGATAIAEPPPPQPIEAPERLSKKEETALRIQEGFSDLSGLLRNIGTKLETQNARAVDLAEQVRPLPPLLNRLSDHLESQRETSVALRESIRGLEASSQAQTEFLKKVEAGHRQVVQMVETFEKSQHRALNVFYKAQKETYEVFKKHQETQSRQFQDIMVKTQKSFTRMLVIFFVAILVAVSAAVVIARTSATPASPPGTGGAAIEREPAPGDGTVPR